MFYLSKRQSHAALAGAGAALAYLAAAELGSKRPVRVGGLLSLATLAMAGIVSSKASVKAYTAHQRIDALVPAVNTALTTANGAVTAVAGKYDKTGGTISGTVMITGDHHVAGSYYGTGGTIYFGDATNHTGSLIINGQNAFTFGHITTNQIGPGGTRADLSGTQTLATLTSRSNFHNETLNGCGVCY